MSPSIAEGARGWVSCRTKNPCHTEVSQETEVSKTLTIVGLNASKVSLKLKTQTELFR
ncbi:hypothetical protein [Helicobacter sp. T3_23-1059]